MLSPELRRRVEEGARRYQKPENPSKFDEALEFLGELEAQSRKRRLRIQLDVPVGESHTITIKVD